MITRYKLLPHQKKFVISKAPTTVMLCGRGAGKSYAASIVATLNLLQQKRIIVFAQNYKALKENLLQEIRRRLDEVIPGQYHYDGSMQKITYRNGVIYGLSYENEDACRGFTEISTAILDEVALSSPSLLSVMTFCMRGKDISPKIYMMSTPKAGGWFNTYIKNNSDKIDIIRATTLDNKFITPEQIELMKQSTPDENLLKQELYGELVDDATQGALFTKNLFDVNIWNKNELYSIGIDCAGLGTDSWCICRREGNRITDIFEKRICDEHEIVHYVDTLVAKYDRKKLCHISVDTAYGLGVIERLREKKYPVIAVPFGSAAKESQVYANKRTELYFNAYKYLAEEGIVGINEELQNELEATRYIMNNSNKIILIPKEEIKLTLGRSPDVADAFALTFAEPLVNTSVVRERAENLRSKLFD